MVLKRLLILILIFFFGILFHGVSLFAQTSHSDSILFTADFFDQTEVLNITLEFDIKKYMKKKSDSLYLPAKLSYYNMDSVEISKEVRVKARGESRRRLCFLPPFWLNIKHSNITDNYFSESKKIKVVTDCRGGKTYDNYLLTEYLIYKIYNIISENSFRVRLLVIKYIDVGRNRKVDESWAFMLEPENLLASRINALPIKFDNLNYRHTDSLSADIMCFFQYMVGNTDFTVNGRHNVKLYKYIDYTKPNLVTVPYDFDFAGLVNADYANPAEILDLENVTERYFLGMCRSDQQYLKVMNIFKDKKDEIYQFIDSFEYLDKKYRKSVINYLEEFYDEMDSSHFIKNRLRGTCR